MINITTKHVIQNCYTVYIEQENMVLRVQCIGNTKIGQKSKQEQYNYSS